MSRIYEVDPYFHIDLGKIVAIHQYMDRVKTRRGEISYEYWIQITIDSGRHIDIDRVNAEKMQQSYAMLLKAWQHYLGDTEEPTPEKEISII